MADHEVTLRINLDAGNMAGQLAGQLGALRAQTTGYDSELKSLQRTLTSADAAQARMLKQMSTTRYAMYDVASSLAIVSAGLIAFAAGSAAVAIAWDRDFAQVVRTNQLAGDSVAEMRGELVKLAQTMPVAFGDIAQIATLAGQLGVAEERVKSFTQTVAKFSAVSDLSVEEAATAFGRLDSLLPDVRGQYEKLGSSIAKVAVESVATESQIVAISTQIAGMGSFAGLTADEVIGLSGALASVGTQPELSRGLVTRLFTNMSRAVVDGGDKLERFAKIAGVSGDTFAQAFGSDQFGPILRNFITGLNDVDRTGGNAVAALEGLGVASVRDVPALLRLAQAGDVVTQAFANAEQGFTKGSELNRQYGIISETTAAKIQILGNNFAALMDAIGGSTTGPISFLVDGLSDLLRTMTALAETPAGQIFSGIAVGVSAVLGVLAALGAAAAVSFAGIIAMQQALAGLGIAVGKIGLEGLIAQLGAAGTAGKIAATGLNVFKGALAGLAAIAGLAITIPLAGWAAESAFALKGLAGDLSSQITEFKIAFSKPAERGPDLFGIPTDIGQQTDDMLKFARATKDFDSGGVRLIGEIDEKLANLARSGNVQTAREQFIAMKEAWVAGDRPLSKFNILMVDTRKALAEAGAAAAQASGPLSGGLGLSSMTAEAEAAAAALAALRQELLQIGSTQIGAEQAAINFARAMNEMQAAAADSEATLDGTNDASLRLREAYIGMGQASLASAQTILDNKGSIEEATAAYRSGREAIVASMEAKLGDRAAAEAWADKILGTAAEAEGAIAAYGQEVKNTPTAHNLAMTNNAEAVKREVGGYAEAIRSTPTYWSTTMVTRYINIVENRTVGANPGMGLYGPHATGGYISGPGSGTSDSILARLSNGEFVIKAAAVNKYGTAFLNAINQGRLPGFAGGGSVSSKAPTMSFDGSIVELGPKTLMEMGRQVSVQVMMDKVGLSRAVQQGDAIRRMSGDFRAK